ncbi:phage tail terminator protein [Rhodococcus qingshengii]|uniref:phage tail terminator protein n=1 Tax=Rhodococcus qingshengii TaxID=334542 RepID=UPI0010A64493|nr:minor capsid protein [Rhodococcus qingshengii]THJ69986.1 hypothetical protein EU244_20215 [Rhodococcus qingshengii]
MTSARAPDTTDLLEALAQRLNDLGVARYDPNIDVYPEGPLPVVFFGQLPDKPATAILLNAYNADHSRDQGNPDYYVQLKFRTAGRDPRTVDRLADAVFRALDDLYNDRHTTRWGDVLVMLCHRHIRGPAMQDLNSRYTRPDSYTITTNPS